MRAYELDSLQVIRAWRAIRAKRAKGWWRRLLEALGGGE